MEHTLFTGFYFEKTFSQIKKTIKKNGLIVFLKKKKKKTMTKIYFEGSLCTICQNKSKLYKITFRKRASFYRGRAVGAKHTLTTWSISDFTPKTKNFVLNLVKKAQKLLKNEQF